MSCRNGLPYGAIFSGFQVSQASFLWSQETWGLLTSKETSKLRKFKLVLVVFGAGILGLAVGPASAGLLVPRLRVSAVGSTPFWLNGTSSSLFPLLLNVSLIDSLCKDTTFQPSLNLCPSSGWDLLTGLASPTRKLRGPTGSNWDRAATEHLINSSSLRDSIDLIGFRATRTMYSDGYKASTSVTTQHAAVAEALFDISQMWTLMTRDTKSAYVAGTSSHALQPYAVVDCTANFSTNTTMATRRKHPMEDSKNDDSDLLRRVRTE